MGLADFYNQNGCTDVESKIKALEKRMCKHPFNGMDRTKRLMLLEKEYCKMGSYHQEVKKTASKNDFKDAYAEMMENQESAYNQAGEIDPATMGRMALFNSVQFYGKEYYTPRR